MYIPNGLDEWFDKCVFYTIMTIIDGEACFNHIVDFNWTYKFSNIKVDIYSHIRAMGATLSITSVVNIGLPKRKRKPNCKTTKIEILISYRYPGAYQDESESNT